MLDTGSNFPYPNLTHPIAIIATKQSTKSPAVPKGAEGSIDVSQNKWIVSKWMDLAFVVGGLMWLLIGAHYLLHGAGRTQPVAMGLPVLLVLLTHAFANTHTMATWIRITDTEQDRKQFKKYYTLWLIPCAGLCYVGFMSGEWSAIFMKIYLLWVLQHYVSQSYGISLIYCFKQKYPIDKTTKNALKYLFLAMALYSAVRQLTFRRFNRGFINGLELPFWGPLPEQIYHAIQIITIALIVFNVYLWIKIWIQQKKILPLPVVMLLITTSFFMVAEGYLFSLVWIYGPALFHGSQYIAIAASFHFKEKSFNKHHAIKQIKESVFSSSGYFYFILLIIGGAFIYRGLPSILSELSIPYNRALTTVFAVVNFHHFVTDRAIWRIRDPKTREILLA